MTQHTPGPWMVCSGMVETVPTEPDAQHPRCGVPIAHMDREPGNGTLPVERDANARLIAAAPEMRVLLRAFLAEWDEMGCDHADDDRLNCPACDARALLAKIDADK